MSNELDTRGSGADKPADVTKRLPVEADEPFVDPKMVAIEASKLPQFLRKAGRITGVYLLSYAAVKGLDQAAETHPDNKFLKGADDIANVVLGFENMAVSGVILIAAAGYEVIVKPKPEAAKPIVALPAEAPKPEQPVSNSKHHRTRANLNAALAPDVPATDKNSDLPVDTNIKTKSQPQGLLP